MVARKRLQQEIPASSDYFPNEVGVECIPSGCAPLDCVLGGPNGGWAEGRIANIVGDKSVGKCARDYYMLTPEGMVYSEDLAVKQPFGASELQLTLALDKHAQVRTTHFWKEEVNRTYTVVTRHGIELTGTPEHRLQVLTPEGALIMRPLSEIKEGEWLVVVPDTNIFPSKEVDISVFENSVENRRYAEFCAPKNLTPALGLWLGILTADGTISSGPLAISAKKRWKRNIIEYWSELLFPGAYKKQKDGFSYSRQVRTFVEFLFEEPLKGKTARYKRVPPIILRSPKPVQAAFLKGLMNFDGEMAGGLTWSTASKRLAREVQLMLLNFGVFGLLHSSYSKEYNWTYYNVGVHGPRIDRFSEEIGLFRPSTKEGKSTRVVSDVLTIPYGGKLIRDAISAARKRLGWARNGKIKDGRRFPSTGAFCRTDDSSSYGTFERNFYKIREFISPEFIEVAERLLSKHYIFDKVVAKKEVMGKQVVTDVHVPEGHLFWANGLINHNTMLAIEACANFAQKHKKGRIFYREAEAAFDEPYAENLGLPLKRVDFGPDGIGTVWDTIEDIFEDLDARLEECKEDDVPGLYIIDSLDALTSRAELERKPGEATFGLEKQKMMGKLFRQLIRRIKSVNFCIIIISQIRDKIGVSFGEKHTRSGGKALDFYASQILWLSHLGRLSKTVKGVKRVVGVRIKAQCKKNKVSLPFRDCEFEIQFGYGTDDIAAGVEWLEGVSMLDKLSLKKVEVEPFLKRASDLSGKALDDTRELVRQAVFAAWVEVEKGFAPSRKKYS